MSQSTALQPQRTARASIAIVRSNESQSRHRGHATARPGYTIAHAGRQIQFGPVAFWIAVGTMVIMAGWSITTATYFAFRDDVLKGLIARHAAQQFAYEDRLAELRAQIDRTTSRQLLDQEQFEQKLEELIHRESTLESRAGALSGIADPASTGAIRSRGAAVPAKPSPIGDSSSGTLRLDRGKQSSIGAKLQHIQARLDSVEKHQAIVLSQMEARYSERAQRVRGVLGSLGLRLGSAPAGIGGPFVPVRLPMERESFERAVTRVNVARTQAEQLGGRLASIPLRKPVTGEIDISSPFGVRMDPFVHEAGMHTGIDFRGSMGDPIHATATGTVTTAGWSGGYGQMVEINHGNGLSTRYGHLSQIAVSVGQTVRAGQVIGRLGSTGRSTGPHVHYETRIDGEPVNPQKFLHAGEKLFGG